MRTLPTDHMNVILTYVCNRNCPGCISNAHRNADNKATFLALSDVERAIKFAKENVIRTVALTGGEPTLHPKVIEIAKMFHESGIEVGIYTNFDFPERVKRLDGIVDQIFASYYGQEMPHQKDFSISCITICTLLYKDCFKTLDDLDNFIDKYKQQADLRFTAPVCVNDYVEEHIADFLDSIPSELILLPDGSRIQSYRGFVIKRPDLGNAFYADETITWKMRPDGKISRFYSDATAQLAEQITDPKVREEVLSTHNYKQRRLILQNHKLKPSNN